MQAPRREIQVSVLWRNDQGYIVWFNGSQHSLADPSSAVVVLVGSQQCIALPRSSSCIAGSSSPFIIGKNLDGCISRLVLVKNGAVNLRFGVMNGESVLKLREPEPPTSSQSGLYLFALVQLISSLTILIAALFIWQILLQDATDVGRDSDVDALWQAIAHMEHVAKFNGVENAPYHLDMRDHLLHIATTIELDLGLVQ